MRIKSLVICAAVIAISASSAPAKEPQSNTVSADKAKEEKKICRWLPVTGSNRQERHCLTKEDWKKAESMSW